MKEYLLLIREDFSSYGNITPEEMQQSIEAHMKWVEKLVEKGNFREGNPLSPTGKLIKGKEMIITDGPFIELKEGISGYYFILASSLAEVMEIAKGCPSLSMDNATLEVREVLQTEA
jgi:hypothetical protein